MERRYLQTDDGVRLPVRVVGEGPPLIGLHGWTGHPQDWQPLLPLLAERFTCYFWEARPHHAGGGSLERMGRDVHELIRSFDLQRPVIMAHSMGVATTWDYLRQFGDDALSALVLIDQSPRLLTDTDWPLGLYGHYTLPENAGFVAELEEDFVRGVIGLMLRSRVSDEPNAGMSRSFLQARAQRLAEFEPRPWIEAWQSLVRQDYRDVLAKIRVPALLAYGGKSRFYGPGVARYVRDAIPGAVLNLYPEAGHSPHLEAKDAFLSDLERFCGQHL